MPKVKQTNHKPAKPSSPKNVKQELKTYFDACVDVLDFSGVALVFQNGEQVFSASAGLASRELAVSNSMKTKFRLASITKPFTAVAIMMLQEDGKLKITDPISKHLKKCPKRWKKITIYHLLTHTSGIPSYTDIPSYEKISRFRTTPKQLTKEFQDLKLRFSPGEKFEYCNSGYTLLGIIIENISGKTYAEFLKENIFEPLGMRDSGVDNNDVILEHRAQGYTRSGQNELLNSGYIDMSVPYAAGAMYSTAEDLQLFDRGLADETLLSKDSQKKMFKSEKDNYACGWASYDADKKSIVGHAGGINGFTTNFERIQSEDYCSVVLSNVEAAPVCHMAEVMRNIVFGAPYKLPKKYKEVKVDPSTFKAFEGQYEMSPEFIITVSREGDWLMAQASGQDKMRMVPHAADEFFFHQIYAQVSFRKNKNNAVSHLILHQNGNDMEGKRLKDSNSSKKKSKKSK